MKQEQVIELAQEAGFSSYSLGALRSGDDVLLTSFANLVEQATLERAAQHFADHNYGEWYHDEVAKELLALSKEQQ